MDIHAWNRIDHISISHKACLTMSAILTTHTHTRREIRSPSVKSVSGTLGDRVPLWHQSRTTWRDLPSMDSLVEAPTQVDCAIGQAQGAGSRTDTFALGQRAHQKEKAHGSRRSRKSSSADKECGVRVGSVQPVRRECWQAALVQVRCTAFDAQASNQDREHLLSDAMLGKRRGGRAA